MNAWPFLLNNGKLIGFGFTLCFLSSVGQTFFISLFNSELRRFFHLSHGDIGAMYAAGTILSAITLVFAGRMVDRLDIRLVSGAVLAGLAGSAALMGLVWSAAVLPVTFFGLRLFGQGLASHTGLTAMGRYFDSARGRAISFASLGYSAGEATLPALVVASLSMFVWWQVWLWIALIVVAVIPACIWLISSPSPREQKHSQGSAMTAFRRQWRLGEVTQSVGFWFRLPTMLTPAFVMTGIFFHQAQLAAEKHWPLPLMAASFTVFALTSFLTTLVAGPLIDRWSARRVFPLILLPLLASCGVIAVFDAPFAAPLFMALIGFSTGFYGVTGTAIWPELYGTKHLGSIKALVQALMVLSSGLSPVVFGMLIDRELSFSLLATGCAGVCAVSAALAWLAGGAARV